MSEKLDTDSSSLSKLTFFWVSLRLQYFLLFGLLTHRMALQTILYVLHLHALAKRMA